MKKFLGIIVMVLAVGVLSACTEGPDDSDVVDHNITKAAKNFEIQRRIVFVNGITDKIQLQVEGRCNIEPGDGKIFVTCKVEEGAGPDAYIRHQLYTSDNVFVVVEQGDPVKASAYHYRFTYKPQAVIPDPDFRGSMGDTPLAEDNQQ